MATDGAPLVAGGAEANGFVGGGRNPVGGVAVTIGTLDDDVVAVGMAPHQRLDHDENHCDDHQERRRDDDGLHVVIVESAVGWFSSGLEAELDPELANCVAEVGLGVFNRSHEVTEELEGQEAEDRRPDEERSGGGVRVEVAEGD